MSAKQPKVVVFDLGKVLLDFDYGIAIRQLVPRMRLTEAGLHALINQSPLLHDYETGLMSTPDFFARVREASGYTGTFDEFAATFGDIFSEIAPMVELHAALHRRGIPTYILSNTNDLAIRHVRQRFPFFGRFTGHVLSYEHRSMKPAARLYEVVEEWSGAAGPELIYFDDRPENVETAVARGWLGCIHHDAAASRGFLEATAILHDGPAR